MCPLNTYESPKQIVICWEPESSGKTTLAIETIASYIYCLLAVVIGSTVFVSGFSQSEQEAITISEAPFTKIY